MNEEQKARVAANEALFRAVNEKIEDVNAAFGTITETFVIICECGNAECGRQLEVESRIYEHIRSDPTLFIVVPGHEIPDVEDIVAHHDGYDVVRKKAGRIGESIVVATDPRA